MELTAFEEALLADAAAGNKCGPTTEEVIDASVGGQWGPARTVRAEVLQTLVTGGLGAVHQRGVQLRGAKIQGTLDLSWSELDTPLSLVLCYFDEPLIAKGAKLKNLELSGSRVVALDLTRTTVEGGVRLDQGFSASGEVRLLDANIGELVCTGAALSNDGWYALSADRAAVRGGVFLDQGFSATGAVRLLDAAIGQLDFRGATLHNEGGDALSADRLDVEGSVHLDEGFSATGEVRMIGATIGGQLSFRGATLHNEGGDALSADGVVVKGGAFLDQGFSATGAVRLPGAAISGQLNFRGAKLDNEGGYALSADELDVKGSVLLDQGFSATGEVRMIGATISSQLNFRGAKLRNEGGDALKATRLDVKGSVLLDEGFSAAGEVGLLGAAIGSQLNCRGAKLDNEGGCALSADGAVVKGGVLLDQGFSATGVVSFSGAHVPLFLWADQHVEGVLDLRDATVERLGDRWVQPLKKGGGARLSGFRYESFVQGTDDSLKLRLAWLRSSPGYTPQPYTQLAAAYRRSGHDDRAREVLIARERDRRKRGQLAPWTKWKSRLLEVTVAHGYKPARAALFLIVLWVIGVSLLLGAPGRQAMVPTKAAPASEPEPSDAAPEQPTGQSCPPRYPCFNPWVYSAETVVPLIELGQTANWQPAGGASRYQIWVWTATWLGWLFTTLGVAGVTGVIRKE